MTWCGSKTLDLIGVDDSTGVVAGDSSWLGFTAGSNANTFTIEGTLDSQFGLYTVHFGVTLDDYVDGTYPYGIDTSSSEREFSFEVEIVPDCAASVIDTTPSITFSSAYQGFPSSETFVFTGLFAYD